MAKIYGGNAPGYPNEFHHVIAEVCSRCYAEALDNGQNEDEIAATLDGEGEDRYVWGVYAGHYCDAHWKSAGFIDDSKQEFDPEFAGERMDEEE